MEKFTCKFCGADIPVSAKFCPNCGMYIRNSIHPLIASDNNSWHKALKEKCLLFKLYIVELSRIILAASKKSRLTTKVIALVLVCLLVVGITIPVFKYSQIKDGALFAVSVFAKDALEDDRFELEGDIVRIKTRIQEDGIIENPREYYLFSVFSYADEESYSIAVSGDEYYFLNDYDIDSGLPLDEWFNRLLAEFAYDLYTEYGEDVYQKLPDDYSSRDFISGKFVAKQLGLPYSKDRN